MQHEAYYIIVSEKYASSGRGRQTSAQRQGLRLQGRSQVGGVEGAPTSVHQLALLPTISTCMLTDRATSAQCV